MEVIPNGAVRSKSAAVLYCTVAMAIWTMPWTTQKELLCVLTLFFKMRYEYAVKLMVEHEVQCLRRR